MRTLIIGGTGTIGTALVAACETRRLPHLSTNYRKHSVRHSPLDCRDADAVAEMIADYRPEVTLFAAPLDARAGIRCIVDTVRKVGGLLCAFSDASVFGDCKVAMREEDELKPMGTRGREHAELEGLLKAELPERHLLIRTHSVYGPALANRLLKRLRSEELIHADAERDTLPTYAPDLAEVAFDLLKQKHLGTFHAVGPDRQTAFQFARQLAFVFGYDADLIRAEADPIEAPRRCQLDRFRLRKLLGTNALRSSAEGLRQIRMQLEVRMPMLQAA